MQELIEKFINEYFNEFLTTITESGNSFFIDIFDEKTNEIILSFSVIGNSVFDIAVESSHYQLVSEIFNINNETNKSIIILNEFINTLNNNKMFNSIFNTISHLDLKECLSISNSYTNITTINYDDKLFGLTTKISNQKMHSIAQFGFRFTNDNELKCLPSISLLKNTGHDLRVGFNLENKSIHLITNTVATYEDFFIENKELENKDINNFVEEYLNSLLAIHNKDSDETTRYNSFEDKISILNMLYI